ncbi:hypothetical protein BGX33_007427 [Mortierella sp. NVP41]|nr:hypothetical protein BGX33_007427 [Mortierella sp. NVP41]
MTDNHLTLFCLVDGEANSQAFSIDINQTKTVDLLKMLISARLGIDTLSKDLTLWCVSIPDDDDDDEIPIVLDDVNNKDKKKLRATRGLLEVFPAKPPKNTIHIIIVQRPQPGDLHADIKRIMDRFFAPGSDVAKFLDAFIKGEGHPPVTTAAIGGLPRAWLRGFGKAPATRPSLLFLGLPDPSTAGSASRNLAAGSILELVKENNRYHIPRGNKETRKGPTFVLGTGCTAGT